ncbi:MAG TPA: T9SS type A sorting domain-containing protein, partial [Chitinophagales bacterium]|nr:T9SS type A sorting domain-containing protein [Chitinophagales bacterium]
ILSSNTNYTVTGTDANNCTGTAVATITVKPKPTTPVITQGHDTLYSSINLAGASYDWYKNGVFHATTSTRFIRITQAGTYTLIIRNNGCSSISSTGFNATLTAIIKNKLAIQLAIVPNPNNGAFDINIVSPAYKNYTLSMFTIAGQEIYTDEFNVHIGQNNKRVSIPNLEKGIYLISIIGEEGTSTQTILVQ